MPGGCVELPGGKSIWFGHFQAVNIGWKPFINVDVANKPAVQQNDMISFMKSVLSKRHFWWDQKIEWDERRFLEQIRKKH